MKDSDLIWKYLEEGERRTRTEAEEIFAEVLLNLIEDTSEDSNGLVCDALESAINHLDCGDRVAEILEEMREEDEGFEEDEEE